MGGQLDRPVLLMLHGAGIDHQTFAPQVEHFGRVFSLVQMDVRGHGQSRPLSQPFSLADSVGDAIALLQGVTRQRAVLLGQSMGGNIAQEIVYRQPSVVSALIAADCVCTTIRLPPYQRLLLRLTPTLLHLLPEAYLRRSTIAVSKQPAVRRYLAATLAHLSKAEIIDFTVGTLRILRDVPGYRVPCPLLILRGEDDRAGAIRQQAPVWAARDRADYAVIARAGHLSNMDNPSAFNERVLAFLERLMPDL